MPVLPVGVQGYSKSLRDRLWIPNALTFKDDQHGALWQRACRPRQLRHAATMQVGDGFLPVDRKGDGIGLMRPGSENVNDGIQLWRGE